MQPEHPDGEGSLPPAGWAPAPGRPDAQRHGWRPGLIAVGLVLGLCGLAGAGIGLASQFLPRSFSPAQQRQIMAWEVSTRWRTLPAGRIFPSAVSYRLPAELLNSATGVMLTAHRLGIARQAGCAAATDPAAARILSRLGCTAVLRASYADSTGSMLVTVGVAVLPDQAAAAAAVRELTAAVRPSGRQPQPGVRPAAFPGTLAAGFGGAQRQMSGAASDGPYLILSAAGYADGRPLVRMSSDSYADQEMSSLAVGVAGAVGAPLGARPAVPHCPGAPGC
jgi:hypothetical protein